MQKNRLKLLYGVLAVVLLGAGCSRTGSTTTNSTDTSDANTASSQTAVNTQTSGEPCGPLKVTVDGKDVTSDYPNGLAYTLLNEGYRIEMVTMYTKAYTCEDVLGKGRIDTNYPAWVQASYNEAGAMLALNENNWPFQTTMGVKASAVGETQSICVDNAQLIGLSGSKFEGKPIVINGALSGTYCGERQQ